MRACDSRNYQSGKNRSKRGVAAAIARRVPRSIFEAQLTHYFRDGFAAVLCEQRIELAIYSPERARPFLHQGRPDLDSFRAGQMRNVCVAASVDSTGGDHVEQIFAFAKKSMRLREHARPALHHACSDVDFE